MAKKIKLINKKDVDAYPYNYRLLHPLSGTIRKVKYRVNYSESEFHQTTYSMVGVFYKPSAILFDDVPSE